MNQVCIHYQFLAKICNLNWNNCLLTKDGLFCYVPSIHAYYFSVVSIEGHDNAQIVTHMVWLYVVGRPRKQRN
jgi:hypothetical protein